MSTITGNVIDNALEVLPKDTPPEVIASALAVITGSIITFIGLIRFGWVVELISLAAISAFMTGSALNIAVGQVPTLLGIPGTVVDNRDSTYLVVINVLKHLNACKVDAAMGLTALAMLYMIRSACNYGAKKIPERQKTFFFISTLRTAFVILFYTMISAAVNVQRRSNPRFRILQDVPRGFQHAAVPTINADIVRAITSDLPASVIVMLIEHIAISKSFGRINNYTIDPSQELVAIGVTNLLGPFLGAYPATGSFSRTAIKSKAGVRTPFAGVITAVVVLLAIYALPPLFYYIPNSSLAGVIIHAVGDLITPPNTVYQFWRISPLEVIIFFAGVIVTVFTTIDIGIYVTISTSMAVFLFRAFKAQGRFLGKVKIHSVVGDHVLDDQPDGKYGALSRSSETSNDTDTSSRNIFLPISHLDGSNPQIEVQKPYPGIFIYRFSEGYNYPNANHYLDYMVKTIFEETRRTNQNSYPRLGVSTNQAYFSSIIANHFAPQDRPWNDPGPRRGQPVETHSDRPELQAIVLDFSSVNNVDITSVQHLIDVRNQLDRYAAPHRVDWHFAHINNRWTKRALAAAGFGYPSPTAEAPERAGFARWKPVFSVAEIGGPSSAAADAEVALQKRRARDIERAASQSGESGKSSGDGGAADSIATQRSTAHGADDKDFESKLADSKTYSAGGGGRVAVVQGLNLPLFHIDLTSALQSAIAKVERRIQEEGKQVAGF